MSTYSCTECGEALQGRVRTLDLELEEGESAQVLDGKVVITTVACSNGCDDEKKQERKPRQKKQRAATHAHGELCAKTEDCDRPTGHTGRCNHKGKETAEA